MPDDLRAAALSGRLYAHPMKIAYILSKFPSVSETFILREMSELARRGIQITVFALDRGDEDVAHPEAQQFLTRAVFRPSVLSWQVPAAKLAALARAPRACLALCGANFARIFCPGFGLRQAVSSWWSAACFASRMRALGIEHVHAAWSDYPARVGYVASRLTCLPFSFSAHARDIFVEFSPFWDEHLRRASFATVCTEAGRRFIEERLGRQSDKLHQIYHGIDVAAFDALVRRGRTEPADAPTILSVGRDVPKKGFHVLARACELLQRRGTRFRALVVGPHEPNGPAPTMCRQRDLPVTWAGPKSQGEVAAAMATAAVLVVPSVVAEDGDRDGLPNVILEAMVARLPVVASEVGGIPEAVFDGETGLLVEPGNPEELADRIEVLLKDEGLRRALGDDARRLVEDRFDVATNVGRLAALFGEAIARRTS